MRSLRFRLLVAITLVAAIALIAVGLFSTQSTQLEFARLQRPAVAAVPAGALSAVQRWYDLHHSWLHVDSILRRAHAQLLLFTMQARFIAASNPQVREATLANDGGATLRVTVSRPGALSQEEQLVLRNPPGAVVHDRLGTPIALLYAVPLPLREQTPATVLTRRLWIAILIALLAAIGAAWLLATQILAPVSALSNATAAMQAGDLTRRVAVGGPEEIAQLARRFNDLSEHLARSEALRKRMISDIAHELRSPLTNIRGIVEALEDGHLTASPDTLRSLGEEASFLEHLVNDLQDLSLADAGQLKFHIDDVAVDGCVRAVAASLTSAAREKKVDIRIRSDESVYARADATRVRQVINNLLTNAIRLAPAHSQINVSVDAGNDAVRVEIRDEGPGIQDHELNAIFERFYRADESRSRADGGAGLGLAIVKQLVEAQGGYVGAVNNAERGATFSFTLPRR